MRIPSARVASPRPPMIQRLLASETFKCVAVIVILGSTIVALLWCVATCPTK